MPTTPRPNLDDLCAALARFLHGIERADRATLTELHERVSTGRAAAEPPNRAIADLIMAEIIRRRR